MRSSLTHIIQKFLQVFLILQHVLVEIRHLGDADDFSALLKKDGDADIFGEGEKCVKVAQDFLVGALLVKLFKMLPVSLERSSLHHLFTLIYYISFLLPK